MPDMIFVKPSFGAAVDRQNSLSRKLAAVYLLNEPAVGRWHNLVGRRLANNVDTTTDLTVGAAGASIVSGQNGRAVNFNGTGYLRCTDPLATTAPFTFAIKFRLTTLGASTLGIASLADTATDGGPLYLLQANGSTSVRALVGNVAYNTIITPPAAGVWYTVVSTITAASSGTESHYLNGVHVATNSRTYGSVNISISPTLWLASGFNGSKDCDIEFCYLWDRVLTAAEVRVVSTQPYAMFWDSQPREKLYRASAFVSNFSPFRSNKQFAMGA